MTTDVTASPVPQWMSDPVRLKRVMGVYAAWTEHRGVQEIALANNISVPQVYVDVRHARLFLQAQLNEQMLSIVLEKVAAHEKIVQNLYKELDELKLNTKPSAKRSVTVAKIMHEVGIQEKMIEEILGMRDRGVKRAATPDPEEDPNMIILDQHGKYEEEPGIITPGD